MLSNDYLYYLDANAIYYYCGEVCSSIDTKRLKNDLKSVKYKIIPACVYREIIVHNMKNPNQLAKITKILGDDNFIVAPSQFDNIDYFFVNYVKNYKKELRNQFNLKIKNESIFLYIISFYVFQIFIISLATKHNIIYFDYLMLFTNEYLNLKQKHLINEINKSLKSDYSNGDKKAKEIFKKLFCIYGIFLNDYLSKILSYRYSYNLKTKEYFAYIEMLVELNKYLENHDDFLKYFNKVNKKHSNLINNQINDFIKLFKDSRLTDLQARTLFFRIKGVLLEKTTFNKNDIYDLFYLYSYSEESLKSFNKCYNSKFALDDVVLLSFDKNLMKKISDISIESNQIIASYKI